MSYLVEFEKLPWQEPSPGIRFKAVRVGSQQIRMVEFSAGFVEPDWCQKGHAGYVLSGEYSIDYTGWLERYRSGDIILIPSGQEAQHKAVLAAGEQVTLLLFEIIDD